MHLASDVLSLRPLDFQVSGQKFQLLCRPVPGPVVQSAPMGLQGWTVIKRCLGHLAAQRRMLPVSNAACCASCAALMQVLDQDYDWVFGSDVTYTEEALEPLAKLLRQMVLTNEQAVVKLAHMHRNKELDKAMREIFHGECQMK